MKKDKRFSIRKAVFFPLLAIYAAVIALGIISPKMFTQVENTVVKFACNWFGWLYQYLTIGMVIICVWVLFSKKIGSIRLGGKDAKPVMSKWNWFAVSLCGGIATGIVFWGIAEPITHFVDGIPGLSVGGTREAALYALSTCYMHWGFPLYAYYAVAGIGIGIAVYNMRLSYTVSSGLYSLVGRRINGRLGDIIDLLCLFSIAGAVSACLGVASMQIGSGTGLLAGFTPTPKTWAIILVIIVATFVISSYTGVQKGLRWMSDKNAKIYLLLLLYVFIVANTKNILAMSTESTGFFAQNWIVQNTYLGVMADGTSNSQWPVWWTLNYWSFMVAYTPMMGIFLAKIARGRTLREFVLFNFALPGGFGMLWFSIFGSASINMEINGAGIYEAMKNTGLESTIFAFFKNLPFSSILSVIFILTAFLSVVTLADGMTTTITTMTLTSKVADSAEPPSSFKVFWGVIMASLAFINIASAAITGNTSGIDATKLLAITCAFPLLFVVLLLAIACVKTLRQYHEKYNVVDDSAHAIVDADMIVTHDEGEI